MSSQPRIAVIASGEMGAGVGGRLVERGAVVVTTLAGRSAASVDRARSAGLVDLDEAELGGVDMILSIVPPGQAMALAQRLAPVLRASAAKPVYVDCNAVSPDTVREVAAAVQATGATFIDAGIVGGPPQPGGATPTIYASGLEAGRFATLNAFGMDIRVMDGPIGQASALKMSYAAVTKGLHAIGVTAMLGAIEAGVAEPFFRELSDSQPQLAAYFVRGTPGIFPKAYRWVAEMQEIGAFMGGGGQQLYEGAARQFERLAADRAADKADETAVLALLRGEG